MLNATVRAVATGLPAAIFNRRRMLLGLAAASTAAATASAAVGPTPTATENPELLRLAEEMPALVDRYHAAWKHQRDTKAKWSPLWPSAPDEITQPGSNRALSGWEETFEGAAHTRPNEEHPRQLIPSYSFRWGVLRAQRALKSKKLLKLGTLEGRTREQWEAAMSEDRRCLELAEAYEAETKRIRRASGYEASWKAHHAATDALADHVARIMAEPDHTMEGLIIKAEALEAWNSVERWQRAFKPASADWHGKIAASILRHSKSAA
ncbi:hypothetical protein [Bosea sp. (in: a-proteobacteria)]|jgi:hypothetical protein|uniref:hypothetical protein n=1 Tax=Bosea sp. (in: a-proteobacteria) TaxID=1871050 RepID=UPI002DDD57CE|nr:hypothetical protein [Bosea sp. (in: a-proteobacteria)]HEV2508654.1 hypothetical protein [Bosea sp. (in: a-proteobacteria)]